MYRVRNEAVNAMLLNEFLKEHRKVQELEAIVAGQQKQIEALTAGLQKVSAQLEASKPAPRVVTMEGRSLFIFTDDLKATNRSAVPFSATGADFP